MQRLHLDSIKSYYEINDPICISIYIPTHRGGFELKQDQIRFKKAIQKAEDDLSNQGLRSAAIQELMKPIHELKLNTPLWQHMSDGFVVFRSENHFSYNQFPVDFPEMVRVQHRFHLKPLLPLMTGNGLYYVLGLSQNSVKLFEGSKYSLKEIESDFLPENLAKALRIDEFLEATQFHTGTRAGKSERSAIFHGQGGAEEDQKELITQFFRQINKNLTPFLTDREVPLVLTGVEYLHPLYHGVNDHKGLLTDGITGNPDQYNLEELHQKSWEIVSDIFEKGKVQAQKKLENGVAKSQVVNGLEQVLKASHQGRVETLFVSDNEQVWGRYNTELFELRLETKEETAEDLLDLCSIKTLLNGGTVYSLKRESIPGGHQVIGLLRY